MRILRSAAAGDIGLAGAGAAGGEAEPAGEGDGADAKPFDWKTPLPENLPETMQALKGKTFQDLLDSQVSLRSTLTEKGNTNTALEEANQQLQKGLEEAKKGNTAEDPIVTAQRQAEDKARMKRYHDMTTHYVETGEVSEDALAEFEGAGVRVEKETLTRFLEFQRFEHQNMMTELHGYVGDQVTMEQVEDCFAWLRAGESPFGLDERRGFDSMYRRSNNAWFDSVMEEYMKEYGEGTFRAGNRGGGKVRRGKPIRDASKPGFKSTMEFQQALIAVKNDPNLTGPQKAIKRRELITQRRDQNVREGRE